MYIVIDFFFGSLSVYFICSAEDNWTFTDICWHPKKRTLLHTMIKFNCGENCSIIMSLLSSNLITFCNLMTFVKPFWMIPSHLARHRGQFCQPVTALISFFLQHDEWVKSTDEFIYGDSLRTVIHNK